MDSSGVIQIAGPDTPRFDHDPDTLESLGLLVEESRSNELPNLMPTTSGGSGTGITNTQVTGLTGVCSTARRFTSGGGNDIRITLGSNTSVV